eukprot:jgi/Tetstr1/463909/TSEL_008719.t1
MSPLAPPNAAQTTAQFRCGLIADIQYADVDDVGNLSGTQWRRYRGALDTARRAVDFFNAQHAESPLAFLLHNGDIIDHKNAFDLDADAPLPESVGLAALAAVLRVLDGASCRPWLFTIGNHEMYNFTRAQLRLGVRCEGIELPFCCAGGGGQLFHSFSPHPAWRAVVLDSYDVSIYGEGRGQGLDAGALAQLGKHNPNVAEYVAAHPEVLRTERMSGGFPYFKGLEGAAQRWVPFNGGIGAKQLQWLRQELREAAAAGQRVVVLTHLIVHPGASSGRTLLWNYQEVLGVLEAAGGGTVAAVVSGHQHEGGAFSDPATGLHHLALRSPLLAEPGLPGPYAVLEARPGSLTLAGHGDFLGSGESGGDGDLRRLHFPLRPSARAPGQDY